MATRRSTAPKSQPNNNNQSSQTAKTKTNVRTQPESLEEQIAMKSAESGSGGSIMKGKILDPKYKESDGWRKITLYHKLQDGVGGIEIHYSYNTRTGEKTGFKFKNIPAGRLWK